MALSAGPGRWTVCKREIRGRRLYRHRALPALSRQKPPPAALGTTGLGDYAADLEDEIAALTTPPILVGHSMGGLLAQMLAARMRGRARWCCWRRRRPGACRPPPCSRSAPPRRMHLQPGYWNQMLEPNRDVALAHSLDRCRRRHARRGLRPLRAGIRPRHLRDHELGPGHQPRQRGGCRAR